MIAFSKCQRQQRNGESDDGSGCAKTVTAAVAQQTTFCIAG
jgi:hypothetical protein